MDDNMHTTQAANNEDQDVIAWSFNPFHKPWRDNNKNSTSIKLSQFGPEILLRCGRKLATHFQFTRQSLAPLFMEMENAYHPLPYHNALHGLSVGQSVACLLTLTDLGKICADDPVIMLALLLAAFGHDLRHPGLGNDFLIRIKAPVTMLYGLDAPLEHMHATELLALTRKHSHELWGRINGEKHQSRFDKLVVKFILATDMSKHASCVAKLQNVEKFPVLPVEDVCAAALHVCDLAGSAKTNQAEEWTARVMQEFRSQGDLEKARGWQSAPMFDRNSTKDPTAMYRFHYDFIGQVVLPLFHAFHVRIPITEQVQECVQVYENLAKDVNMARL